MSTIIQIQSDNRNNKGQVAQNQQLQYPDLSQQQFQQQPQSYPVINNQFQNPNQIQVQPYQSNFGNNTNQLDNNFEIQQQIAHYDNNYNGQQQYDEDYQDKGGLSEGSRIQFIRKVYLILLAQIVFTIGFCYIQYTNKNFLKVEEKYGTVLLVLSMIGSFLTIILLGCFKQIARSVPLNYILLAIFTLCEAFLVSIVVSAYPAKLVLWALGLTFSIFCGLTVYSFYTKTDFTNIGGFLFCVLFGMIGVGILLIFYPIKLVMIAYNVIGILLFSLYLVYDTQLILGKFGNSYSIDDYIMAAINIYLDLINLFLHILKLLGESQ